MFSIQRLLGRPKVFFGLLLESAELGQQSVAALRMLLAQGGAPELADIHDLRRKDKQVIHHLEEALVKYAVTPIEREDIEALAQALYRLPKAVEKVAKLYAIGHHRLDGADFSIPLQMLQDSAAGVVKIVTALAEAKPHTDTKALDARMSQIEADSAAIINDSIRRIFEPGGDALREIIIHDVYRTISLCLDACRQTSRTVALISLKNS